MVKISSLCKYLVIVECIHQIRFLAYVFVVILQRWDRMVVNIACALCTLHAGIALLKCSHTGEILTEI